MMLIGIVIAVMMFCGVRALIMVLILYCGIIPMVLKYLYFLETLVVKITKSNILEEVDRSDCISETEYRNIRLYKVCTPVSFLMRIECTMIN